MNTSPRKTTITLDADVDELTKQLLAARQDLTLSALVNIALRYYARHHDQPEFDVTLTKLDTILKTLAELQARPAGMVDVDTLAASIIARLPPPSSPPVLVHAPPPPTRPARRSWWARWSRQRPPVEHW